MGSNVIQLNGKLYNAETGKPLKVSGKKDLPAESMKTTKSPKHGIIRRSVDGLSAGKTSPKKSARQVRPEPAAKPIVSRSAGIAAHTKPQRTKTLKRTVVTKPTPTTKASSPSTLIDNLVSKKLVSSASKEKPLTARSPLISKFYKSLPGSISKQGITKTKPVNRDVKVGKLADKSSSPATKPRLSPKEELITQKMAELNKQSSKRSKKHPSKKHRVVKITSILVCAVVILVIGLYIIYLNIPNVAIKYASYRAGFDASLPRFTPSGYSYHSPLQYQPGQVIISYKSNSDNRKYSVTEQPTQWDSEAAYNNYVSKQSNQPPYTFQDSGLTIYVFGNSSAAWVNGGKFYSINGGTSDLSPEQLQNIATSL